MMRRGDVRPGARVAGDQGDGGAAVGAHWVSKGVLLALRAWVVPHARAHTGGLVFVLFTDTGTTSGG